MQYMIDAGADVNVGDYDGKPPLRKVIKAGKTGLIPVLAQAGADVNAKKEDG